MDTVIRYKCFIASPSDIAEEADKCVECDF